MPLDRNPNDEKLKKKLMKSSTLTSFSYMSVDRSSFDRISGFGLLGAPRNQPLAHSYHYCFNFNYYSCSNSNKHSIRNKHTMLQIIEKYTMILEMKHAYSEIAVAYSHC